MDNFEKIKGRWVHSLPWDSDDYLAIYEIGGSSSNPEVAAWDTADNESFDVSQIDWDGQTLSFETLMPSTNRRGINRFKLLDNDNIESEFTFTIVETMHRETPDGANKR